MAVNGPAQPTPAQATSRSTRPATASAVLASWSAPASGGQVGGQRNRAGAGRHALQAADVPPGHQQPPAVRGQAVRHGRPDPGRRAGHQGHAAGPGVWRAGARAAGERNLAPAVMMPIVKASSVSA